MLAPWPGGGQIHLMPGRISLPPHPCRTVGGSAIESPLPAWLPSPASRLLPDPALRRLALVPTPVWKCFRADRHWAPAFCSPSSSSSGPGHGKWLVAVVCRSAIGGGHQSMLCLAAHANHQGFKQQGA
jgi:hypothetical protein